MKQAIFSLAIFLFGILVIVNKDISNMFIAPVGSIIANIITNNKDLKKYGVVLDLPLYLWTYKISKNKDELIIYLTRCCAKSKNKYIIKEADIFLFSSKKNYLTAKDVFLDNCLKKANIEIKTDKNLYTGILCFHKDKFTNMKRGNILIFFDKKNAILYFYDYQYEDKNYLEELLRGINFK